MTKEQLKQLESDLWSANFRNPKCKRRAKPLYDQRLFCRQAQQTKAVLAVPEPVVLRGLPAQIPFPTHHRRQTSGNWLGTRNGSLKVIKL